MAERIAIKKLRASDCTLFEAAFRQRPAGNQKSINLNADVLTGKLYPNLAAVAAATDNEIALAITIYGPGGKGAQKIARKIIKGTSYKNWRLNGEFVLGPPDDTARYDDIRAGDFAIMAFKGDAAPSAMDLIIVSQTAPADAPLHAALNGLFGKRSMIEVTPAQITAVAIDAATPRTHPVYIAATDPTLDAALESAAHGDYEGAANLLKNRGGRKVSASALAKAKAKAELTGQDGEGLVNGYLAAKVSSGKLASYEWASAENAISPYDFEIATNSGERTRIDVKATSGPFVNVIHISLAEVIAGAEGIPYCIYRVFDLTEDGGRLRISADIGVLAKLLKATHEAHMPPGIRVDGFSVPTSALSWVAEEYVERPEDDETT